MSSCRQLGAPPLWIDQADKMIVKQFIRNVRASKTIADERAVVQKESAAIRASFREESADHNVRFVAHSIDRTSVRRGADSSPLIVGIT